MQQDVKRDETLSPEIQEVMRNLVLAIRAVRMYPPNNPVYFTSVKKSFEALDHFLQTDEKYYIGIDKTHFTFKDIPLGKDAQLNRPIAQDLFAKGIRGIVFSNGLTEEELLTLCQGLALSAQEQAMKSGISSILWENGVSHIKVTEAGLEEIIKTQTAGILADKTSAKTSADSVDSKTLTTKKPIGFSNRTLVLGEMMIDPMWFSASMVDLAEQTKADHETMEDRLFALYKEAGRKIDEQHSGQRDTMYEGLAKSVLALDPRYRNGFIAGKLYGELDAEMASEEGAETDQQLPNALHEVQTGRFSNAWTVQQMATLLKKSASKQIMSSILPSSPDELEVLPIPSDMVTIAKEMMVYNAEDMAELKALGDIRAESDIIVSFVHTLISLIPLVKSPWNAKPEEKDITLFSGVIHQLEDMLSYFLEKKDYDSAVGIIQAFNMPVDPAFKTKMMEASKKAESKAFINAAIGEMQKHPKDSPEYHSVYAYLSTYERESTEVLLKLLAEENDRTVRFFYLDLMKDVSKNQTAMLGKYLSDDRWYVVRNIVNLLGESKADEAIAFIKRAAEHENTQIRQEVIKGLLSIGGKRAASILVKFLKDKDAEVKKTAIRAFPNFPGISAAEVKSLVVFLEDQPLKKKKQELTLEAIKALGKIGSRDIKEFLARYTRIRWWKSRKLQKELRAEALQAIEEITKRYDNDERTKQ